MKSPIASILFLVDRQNPKKRDKRKKKKYRGGAGGGEERFSEFVWNMDFNLVRYYLVLWCTNEIARWCYTQGVPKSFYFVYSKNNISFLGYFQMERVSIRK